MENVIIKPFIEKQCDALYELIVLSINSTYPEYYPKEAVEYFVNYQNKDIYLADSKKGQILLLYNGDILTGTGTIIGSHVKRVFFHPQHLHKGYGKKMMEELESIAHKNNETYIDLHSSFYAKRFYDKLNYKLLKVHGFAVENEERLYYQRMVKILQKQESSYINIHNKKFNIIKNDGPGAEVNENTIFQFYQHEHVIYATYHGGEIEFGELIGTISNSTMKFNYSQININKEWNEGHSSVTIDNSSEKLRLIDNWQWDSKEGTGECIFQEM